MSLRSARAYLRVKRPKPTCSYDFAGAAAAEVAKIVWGTTRDRRTWAGFCRYGNCDDIIERAHLYASMFEQGEIKNPITSPDPDQELAGAILRLIVAGKDYLVSTLLLIAENRDNREKSMLTISKATYFRHRDELLDFFVRL